MKTKTEIKHTFTREEVEKLLMKEAHINTNADRTTITFDFELPEQIVLTHTTERTSTVATSNFLKRSVTGTTDDTK